MVGKIYVFLVCFVVFILACSRKEIDPNNYPINIQNEDLIVLKERDFLDTLKLINSFVFFGEPLGFSVERGEIYVLELFSKDFYRLSANGEILAKYPIGNGEGPHELMNPIYFSHQNGQLDILDAGNLTVKKYRFEDQSFKWLENIRVKNRINKFLKMDDDEYLYITDGKEGIEFRSLDRNEKTKSLEFINDLFFPIEVAGMHYDGRIKAFDDKVYYFLMGNSKFLCFTKENLDFIGEMIHKVPRRNIQTTGNMSRVVSFETAVFDFDVDSKYIYLLSGVPYKNLGKDSFSLDLYDATNGKYLHSYH
ncbi:hypothetical protein [Cecembia calidifontis]|uniref:6-bladed beta-propeller protein n=1 Tax=Cecembia calidifontis TaxID=1187080 RepID=A0A4Q7P555_9BACT|nr:hypothetical protein [Cecembia calidifontis]RZS94588.1 hypothetical protein BC751_0089 [Cecembia calidifontis]